jgi:hypothetical protein
MKIFNTIIGVLIAVCVFCAQISCKKENDNYDLFPIKLTLVDTLGTTKLSWTKIETSDFIEYVIVRSSRDSIGRLSDLSENKNATIVSRVSTAKQNEFFDNFNSAFIFNRVYYRVFARLKNRTISSANHVLNSDLSIVNVPPSDALPQDEFNPNLVYFNSSNTGQIILYDLEKDTVLARASNTLTYARTLFASNKGNDGELVQFVNGSKSIVFRDAKTLDIKFTMNSTYTVYNVEGSQDGFICIFTDDLGQQYKMIRLSDHTVVSTQSYRIDNTNYYSNSTSIIKFPNSSNVLLCDGISSSPNFAKLTYDAEGNFTDGKILGRFPSNGSNTPINKISAKSNYYFLLGSIYAAPLNPNKPLNAFIPNDYTDVVFKQDESKFYLIKRNFNSSSVVSAFEEYNLPNGKLQRTLTAKISGRIIFYKDKAYIFGTDNSSSSQRMILQKIQL